MITIWGGSEIIRRAQLMNGDFVDVQTIEIIIQDPNTNTQKTKKLVIVWNDEVEVLK